MIECRKDGLGLSYSYYVNKKARIISRDGVNLTKPEIDYKIMSEKYYDGYAWDNQVRFDLKGKCLIGFEVYNKKYSKALKE